MDYCPYCGADHEEIEGYMNGEWYCNDCGHAWSEDEDE